MAGRRLRPLRPAELDTAQRALRAALTDPPGRVESAPDGSLHGPFDAMLRAPRTGRRGGGPRRGAALRRCAARPGP